LPHSPCRELKRRFHQAPTASLKKAGRVLKLPIELSNRLPIPLSPIRACSPMYRRGSVPRSRKSRSPASLSVRSDRAAEPGVGAVAEDRHFPRRANPAGLHPPAAQPVPAARSLLPLAAITPGGSNENIRDHVDRNGYVNSWRKLDEAGESLAKGFTRRPIHSPCRRRRNIRTITSQGKHSINGLLFDI
jgi:hypothetical protein